MKQYRKSLGAFFADEDGSQTIEFVVMVPLLVWAVISMLAFTDAYRVRAMASDATAVVADTLSRQTTPINNRHLEGLQSVAGKITGQGEAIGIRVTQVGCSRNCENLSRRVLEVSFSKSKNLEVLDNADFRSGELRDKIPLLSRGDRIVLVETGFTHKPILNAGLKESQVNMFQTTRMRFAPQLCWEECNL